MKWKVRFYKDRLDEWRWQIRASNGSIVADSAEGYARGIDCHHAFSMMAETLKRGAYEIEGYKMPASRKKK